MVLERLIMIIVDQMGCKEEDITLKTTSDDLGMGSLDRVQFTMSVEDEFDIDIPDDEVMKISTVGEMVDYIKNNT